MANEKRLIDAKPIVQFIMDGLNNPDKMKALGHDAIEILAEIEYAPTVDAVEVVRCKDCIYWEKATANKKGFLICPASGMEIMAHDFCSYGEKRDNERKAD